MDMARLGAMHPDETIETGELSAGEYCTHFRCAGRGAPLVLLHGAGGDGSLFDPVLGPLAGTRRVVAPDLLGHGSTKGPSQGYTVGGYCRWLGSFLKNIATEPVDLAGHSLGGAIALRFAARNPDAIRRLVLVDSIALGVPSLHTTLVLLGAVFSRHEKCVQELVARAIFYGGVQDARQLMASASIPHGAGGFLWMYSRTWSAALPIASRVLNRITAPTMILWGQQDRYFPVRHAKRAVRCIPGVKLQVIPFAGHLPFLEQPEPFCGALEEFLS